MSNQLIECISNYSEARRPQVVEAILQSISAVPGVTLLDHHSDTDHNRTVVTFVGEPEPVVEAAFQSIKKAAELINLDEHTGEHPRIGATDVVPFVPISGITMEDCALLATRLARRVGEELQIPVYLYEEAATRPERKNLENIRRGQYEALKAEMGVDPARDPDFGPHRVGPAGATVIGARQPLVAFNVYLTTDDVSIADKIARAVRHSSGGLRFVKALGLLVEGRAQVSMNLTNYRRTPIPRVVETVRREAERYGVGIHHTELVGLIPQEALIDTAVWYTQLDQFDKEQLLERKLYAATSGQSFEAAPDFIAQLAAGTPAPGGGSAAAHTGAAAAALVAMVCRLTIGRKKYAAVEAQMRQVLEQAEVLRANLAAGVEKDAAAYEQVMATYKLPKDTPEQESERNAAIEQAMFAAAQVPLETARMAVQVLELGAQAVSVGNVNTLSDGGTSAALAIACLAGSALNVRTNVHSLQDPAAGQVLLAELQSLEMRAHELEKQIQAVIHERGGF
ncbi:MAG TPA: glutamate formimidoyltransferase [Anaerolineales bacterium]|nr:glutamate formimidoyltransferase [Anaerolineales bacterium]